MWETKTLAEPRLIFSVPAWCKLQYFLFRGTTEIGGYGVALDPGNDLLYINEFAIHQTKRLPTGISRVRR